ncbi:Lipid A biosynthesis lauroyl acyltransferase [Acinetobacter stercoris]|uniref:Lipid A biosynthesis lauroyl acyltransferase n=1 Tax=Acinetobacter stercoris TaxID=2126983 RepID=A0A2U3N4C9_9GAMM|nr:Lipid A biosynthesis lauroyl acyltransferase [Acinetobacter stercoris]
MYQILIEPKLDHFPGNDEIMDSIRINKILELQIRIVPTQYMWFHRRFKTQPIGYEKIYAN